MKKPNNLPTFQEQVNKASIEISEILQKYGFKFRVVHSIELIPDIKQEGGENDRKINR